MTKEKNPEDFTAKLDMCLTDALVKSTSGVLLGTLASFMFKGRRWPIIAGLGVGVGLAYANCEYEINPRKVS